MSRIRVEPRRRVSPWPAVAAVGVAAVLLAVAAVRPAPSTEDVRPGVAAVSRVALTCPAPAAGGRAARAVGVVAGSGAVGVRTGDEGSRTARTVPGGRVVDGLGGTRGDGWASAVVPSDDLGAVSVGSIGALAPGAVAVTAAESPRALGGGLTAAACTDGEPERWFVGAGGLDRTGTVVLTNPTDAVGVVDLTLAGRGGAVEAVGGTGVVVRAGTVRTVTLADLAADTDGLALRAVARRGSVDVAVLDTGAAGTGSAWVPPASAPARTQVVPGGVGGADDATVEVLNPGRDTATVEVALLGADGRFQARGAEQVEVPARGTARLALPASAARQPWAASLRSSVPVTGAVTAGVGTDLARSAATPALDAPAVVPTSVPLADGVASVTTQVSNADPQRPARLSVRALASDGSVVSRGTVEVAPGATVALPRPAGAAALVVDAGGGSAVHAAAVVRSGSGADAGVDVVPVVAAPGEVVAPVVTPLR